MDKADAAWMLISTALVIFMVPGLALFYGGMGRAKNVLNMMLMSMYCLAVVPIVWFMAGYSLAVSTGETAWLGDLSAFALDGIGPSDDLITVAFLMSFAVITPALISGAVADRMKFSAWAIFVPIWSLIVYSPVVYWIYGADGDGNLVGVIGQGLIGDVASLDFAGGTAIHINAGIAALVMALIVGKRSGWPSTVRPPHSLPLVIVGTGILWFGWFGFNVGSAFGVGDVAAQAFMNTFLAPAAAMCAWMFAERLKDGHFTTLGAASGAVAGLVAITPAAGYVAGASPIWIGLVAGVVCYFAVSLKYRMGYDDSLDVVGVHLVGGIVGGLALGFFADPEAFGDVTAFGRGLFYGGGVELLVEQVLSMLMVMAYSAIGTAAIALALRATIGVRSTSEDEIVGLDTTEHAETAYNLADAGSGYAAVV